MNTFSDTLLSAVDHFSRQLGPITNLMDSIIDHIAPKTTARADCNFVCTSCDLLACGGGDKGRFVESFYIHPGCFQVDHCFDVDHGCTFC